MSSLTNSSNIQNVSSSKTVPHRTQEVITITMQPLLTSPVFSKNQGKLNISSTSLQPLKTLTSLINIVTQNLIQTNFNTQSYLNLNTKTTTVYYEKSTQQTPSLLNITSNSNISLLNSTFMSTNETLSICLVPEIHPFSKIKLRTNSSSFNLNVSEVKKIGSNSNGTVLLSKNIPKANIVTQKPQEVTKTLTSVQKPRNDLKKTDEKYIVKTFSLTTGKYHVAPTYSFSTSKSVIRPKN
jgi:hypothetical protein